jgi:DNA-binding response OmpR family regulator
VPGTPIPVLLLRHGPVGMRELAALHDDERFELFVADRLTPEWTSFAQRVAGVIVVTDGDPMNALLYAVTGGIKGPIVLMFSRRYGTECREFIAAGASACITTPVTIRDLDRVVPILSTNASLSRVDKTLGLLLDPITLTVRLQDQSVRLTQREFAVLQCLSSYQGRPVAAHKLVSYVWGDRSSHDDSRNILDVYVFQLRKKLERLGLKGAISTVRGLGYALVQVSGSRDLQ